MNQISNTQQQEIQNLKACITEWRGSGAGRRPFPDSIVDRVVTLQRAGLPVRRLASDLGVAASQIYSWKKIVRPQAPKVLKVEAPAVVPNGAQCAQGALHLRFGAFCVTIAMAEA